MTKPGVFHNARVLLRAEKLTDEEYAELIRNVSKTWIKLRVFMLCCAGLAILVAVDMTRRMYYGVPGV